jgi:hypothetical protein
MQKNRMHHRLFHAEKAHKHCVLNLLSFGVFFLFYDNGLLFQGMPFLLLALASIAWQLITWSRKCSCSKRVIFATLPTKIKSTKVMLLVLSPILLAVFASFFLDFSYGFAFIFGGIWVAAWSGKILKWSSSSKICDPKELERQDFKDLSIESANDLISYHLQMRNFEKADALSRQLVQKLDESQ